MRQIKSDNRRNQMQPFRIATYRSTLSRVLWVTTFLIISLLASLPEVSRAQLPCSANCHYLTIVESGGVGINCVGCQTLDSCNGALCSDSVDAYYITLNASATCCIDSILITPPTGVCWKGCMATPNSSPPPAYNLWGIGFGGHTNCEPGTGKVLGSPLFQLCAGDTIYGNMCTTSQTTISGFSFTFYWHDGTTCTKIAP